MLGKTFRYVFYFFLYFIYFVVQGFSECVRNIKFVLLGFLTQDTVLGLDVWLSERK